MDLVSSALMEKLVSLCKRRGFIFPSSEIYGGLNGCWDYGPLGVELKRNIKEAWWQDMITSHDELEVPPGAPGTFSMVGLDCSILMNPRVWEASGHVGGFADLKVDCRETQNRYRADQLVIFEFRQIKTSGQTFENDPALQEGTGTRCYFATPGDYDESSDEDLIEPHRKMIEILKKKKPLEKDFEWDIHRKRTSRESGQKLAIEDEMIRSKTFAPGAKNPGSLTEPRPFNLMLETHTGALKDTASIVYLRPETAQGIFVNFKNVCDTARVRIPFGIGQIGKAFRNEINPRNFTFRSREFEQMEIEFFCRPEEAEAWYVYWRDRRFQWYINLGLKSEKLRLRNHEEDELAHYARGCADVEYEFPFGISELEGIANRTDFDLKAHMEHSGKDLQFFDDQTQDKSQRKYVPYVIEPSAGADRATLAFLCEAFTEDEVAGETRTVMKFHPRLAPIKVAVFPLVKKDGMPEKAREIYRGLRKRFNVFYDQKGAIGRRYRRQDEAGTPFCVTVDGQTFTDGTVTVRDRDSTDQIRIDSGGLAEHLQEKLIG